MVQISCKIHVNIIFTFAKIRKCYFSCQKQKTWVKTSDFTFAKFASHVYMEKVKSDLLSINLEQTLASVNYPFPFGWIKY